MRSGGQPSRANSSTKQRAIASTPPWPGVARRTATGWKGSSSSNSFSATQPPHFREAALQVELHDVLLVAGRVAGGGRLPLALAAQAAGLRLGDSHQRLLGDGVHGVVVRLAAEDEGRGRLLLVEERVRLVHGHGPVPRDALLRAVAEAGLVARVCRDG